MTSPLPSSMDIFCSVLRISRERNAHRAMSQDVTYRKVWAVAWPIIIANSTTPMLGLVDTAIIGHIGEAAPLGGIALGSLVFNFLYWGFGFLRMGTTGFTAQAVGANDEMEIRASLGRAGLIALGFGLLIVLCQTPIAGAAFYLLEGGESVEALGRAYVDIRIWGAPATLLHIAFVGWFIGLQKTRWSLGLLLWLNTVNITADIVFVVFMGWGVEGVAAGTLLAELSTVMLGGFLVYLQMRRRPQLRERLTLAILSQRTALKRLLSVNGDIFIRTLCLFFSFAWFTAKGAQSGEIILAANFVLFQFVVFAAFFLDGFAFAAEALVGSAIGARSTQHLKNTVTLSTHLAFGTAVLISLCFGFFGVLAIDALTSVDAVREQAYRFLPWAVAIPVISVWCFQFDGIFIGATRTADMRNMMLLSLLIYIAAWYVLAPLFGNHGLWAALSIFFAARGLTLALRYPKLVAAVSAPHPNPLP